MGTASIPVDVFNPGQVFACLGFLEAADVLCGPARAGFKLENEVNWRFVLQTPGEKNPFEVVLDFIVNAEVWELVPPDYVGQNLKQKKRTSRPGDDEESRGGDNLIRSHLFPIAKADPRRLPVRLKGGSCMLEFTHWSDGSSRDDFKLYAGNRSAAQIFKGLKDKVEKLWTADQNGLIVSPFDKLGSIGGSFNFDPRGAWDSIDVGYSPHEQKHSVSSSPVVELLAAVGLEHARPTVQRGKEKTVVRYAVWLAVLPPFLARPSLAGSRIGIPLRNFRFNLGSSGKNKIVAFAEEEIVS